MIVNNHRLSTLSPRILKLIPELSILLNMDILSILLIAVGLAMDAFAVAIVSGLTLTRVRAQNALTVALFFGTFQALMPVIGWLSGNTFKGYIADVDHWVAFGLLTIVGCRMIYESFRFESDKKKIDPENTAVLFILAIATSIDALAVGITLSLLDVAIVIPAVIIGTVTFVLSYVGVYIGNKFGHFFERKIELIGGLILIGIGIKILIDHLH
jgi:putative Mn2+ efflux pump MntP